MFAILFTSTQGISFLTILAAGFVYLLISGLLSAGHDLGHDAHLDATNAADGAGHAENVSEGNHPTISIFSPRIIAIFAVGLGGGGAIGTFYGLSLTLSLLIGLALGAILGALGSFGMKLLYNQQASSEVRTENSVGRTATVTVEIAPAAAGEIGLTVQGQYMTYLARGKDPAKTYPKGSLVKVSQVADSVIIVE